MVNLFISQMGKTDAQRGAKQSLDPRVPRIRLPGEASPEAGVSDQGTGQWGKPAEDKVGGLRGSLRCPALQNGQAPSGLRATGAKITEPDAATQRVLGDTGPRSSSQGLGRSTGYLASCSTGWPQGRHPRRVQCGAPSEQVGERHSMQKEQHRQGRCQAANRG